MSDNPTTITKGQLMADSTKKMMREMAKLGWRGSLTGGDHVIFRHPDTSAVIRTGTTPSDRRVFRKIRIQARRLLEVTKEPVS